jgi:hypothetical protein
VLRSKGANEGIHLDGQCHPTCFSSLADGKPVRQIGYYPYGGTAFEVSLLAEPNRYGFGTHPQVPQTGLTHFGVRTYNPRLGRDCPGQYR